MRRLLGFSVILILAGCAGLPDDLDEWCRDSSRCTPQCGSVATGASPDCDTWENEGRTRG